MYYNFFIMVGTWISCLVTSWTSPLFYVQICEDAKTWFWKLLGICLNIGFFGNSLIWCHVRVSLLNLSRFGIFCKHWFPVMFLSRRHRTSTWVLKQTLISCFGFDQKYIGCLQIFQSVLWPNFMRFWQRPHRFLWRPKKSKRRQLHSCWNVIHFFVEWIW